MDRPATTRALTFGAPGSPFEVQTIPLPPLSPTELLIEVHAASINPVDLQIWRLPLLRLLPGLKGVGRDFSGKVVEVGSAVKGWVVGDECFGLYFRGNGKGTITEGLIVDPAYDTVVKKPSDVPHTSAAAVPLVALTALSCLSWLPQARPNEQRKVIVQGASGGTGTWLVQLAKKLHDCHVTAICSGKNAQFVRDLGADDVLDYTKVNVSRTLVENCPETKYDLIVDCVGGTEILQHSQELLHTSGAYVTIVGDKTSRSAMGGPLTYLSNPAQVFRYLRGYIWGPRYATIAFTPSAEDLQQVLGLIKRGEVIIEVQEVIDGILDGDEGWKRMVELTDAGRVRGKVVLRIV